MRESWQMSPDEHRQAEARQQSKRLAAERSERLTVVGYNLFGGLVILGAVLGALYAVVRFIKWAWSD